jgi:hypothetical protein
MDENKPLQGDDPISTPPTQSILESTPAPTLIKPPINQDVPKPKSKLVLGMAIAVIVVIILFSPLPSIEKYDSSCKMCGNPTLESCPPCPQKGDCVWKPPIYTYLLTLITHPERQEAVQIISSPTPTVIENPTADWKTYTNKQYGFEVGYNPQSPPNEEIGSNEDGQFTFLFQVNFGTNPVKFPFGYQLQVRKPTLLEDYRLELVGHTTDKIDTEEKTTINGIVWTKFNYKIFLTTEYVPMTKAVSGNPKYSYSIICSTSEINQILSTFKYISNVTKVTSDQAIQIINTLSEVKSFFAGTPDAKISIDETKSNDNFFSIHVYQSFPDHTATFHWYNVNKTTGEVTKQI